MAAAAAIMGVVGGGASALGTLESGAAAQNAGQYNAGIADYNAAQEQNSGNIAVAQQQRKAAQLIGAGKASYGASGVDSNSGSALAVMQNSASQAAIDSINLKQSYNAKQYGYEATANLDSYEGDQARTSSYFSAAGQLLGAGGKAAGAS